MTYCFEIWYGSLGIEFGAETKQIQKDTGFGDVHWQREKLARTTYHHRNNPVSFMVSGITELVYTDVVGILSFFAE